MFLYFLLCKVSDLQEDDIDWPKKGSIETGKHWRHLCHVMTRECVATTKWICAKYIWTRRKQVEDLEQAQLADVESMDSRLEAVQAAAEKVAALGDYFEILEAKVRIQIHITWKHPKSQWWCLKQWPFLVLPGASSALCPGLQYWLLKLQMRKDFCLKCMQCDDPEHWWKLSGSVLNCVN